LFLVSTG
jgi:hypothetical protein